MASIEIDDVINEELNCPICFDLLTEPITLPNCFHSFCKTCIEQTTQGARETYRYPYSCPQCRRRFVPSDLQKINIHLQNIVNSQKRTRDKIDHMRQSNMSKVTPEGASSGPSGGGKGQHFKTEIENVTSFLSTVDNSLQSLMTALDETTPSPQNNESETESHHSQVEMREEDQHNHMHTDDCEFRAETLDEFWYGSLLICRKHFILIMFIIHACALLFCFFMAVR